MSISLMFVRHSRANSLKVYFPTLPTHRDDIQTAHKLYEISVLVIVCMHLNAIGFKPFVLPYLFRWKLKYEIY